jgi:hypothetical protein
MVNHCIYHGWPDFFARGPIFNIEIVLRVATIFFACLSYVKPKIPQFTVNLSIKYAVHSKTFTTGAAKNLWRAAVWPRLVCTVNGQNYGFSKHSE